MGFPSLSTLCEMNLHSCSRRRWDFTPCQHCVQCTVRGDELSLAAHTWRGSMFFFCLVVMPFGPWLCGPTKTRHGQVFLLKLLELEC